MGGDSLPSIIMVLVQVGYAGMNIISKLAMDSGMNPFVHVAYRQIFASLVIVPFAYFLERKTRPKMTPSIFFQIFLCSIFGVTMNQITYFVGLKNSTPTIACALSNLLPAVTFLLAVPFRLEIVRIKTRAGQAKVIGTLVCVGGAMLLSFYNGAQVKIGESRIDWKYADNLRNININNNNNKTSHGNIGNFILGPFLLIASSASWAIWFILQARLGQEYPATYSSTAMMCLMASFQSVVIGLGFDHDSSAWSLALPIRAVSTIYAGIVSSALAYCMMSWCIEKKGPLYVSVFSPLLLVIVAILSWALLREKLFVGTVVGSILIVIGLYGVLWGKSKEMETMENIKETEEKEKHGSEKDLELHTIV